MHAQGRARGERVWGRKEGKRSQRGGEKWEKEREVREKAGGKRKKRIGTLEAGIPLLGQATRL